MRNISIAIDGYVASGKGTIAKELAKKYNLSHIDTGAFYRAIALETINHPNYNIEKVLNNIDLKWQEGNIYLNGKDVTLKIREQEVTDQIDRICNLPIVREYVTFLTRNIAKGHSVVIDGRDIGNNILPLADIKFLITADRDVRIERRIKQNERRGIQTNYKTISEDVDFRDKRDVLNMGNVPERIIIDNTNLTLEETIQLMSKYIDQII